MGGGKLTPMLKQYHEIKRRYPGTDVYIHYIDLRGPYRGFEEFYEAAKAEGIDFVRLTPEVLSRALEPFPVNVRTLDGLHLATMEYLRDEGESIELATFDARMIAAARSLGIAIYQA